MKMSVAFERYWPIALATAGGMGYHYADVQPLRPEEVLSSSISIGSIFAGFVATEKAIIISLPNSVARTLLNSAYRSTLLSYINVAILSSLALCVLSFLGYFHQFSLSFGTVWSVVATLSIATFLRVTYLTGLILDSK